MALRGPCYMRSSHIHGINDAYLVGFDFANSNKFGHRAFQNSHTTSKESEWRKTKLAKLHLVANLSDTTCSLLFYSSSPCLQSAMHLYHGNKYYIKLRSLRSHTPYYSVRLWICLCNNTGSILAWGWQCTIISWLEPPYLRLKITTHKIWMLLVIRKMDFLHVFFLELLVQESLVISLLALLYAARLMDSPKFSRSSYGNLWSQS